MSTNDGALAVTGLSVGFDTRDGHINMIDDVSLALRRGKTLALVGESGCGKSLLTLALMGLVDRPGRVTGGELEFGEHRYGLPEQTSIATLRGARAAMVFQEPMSALNPVLTVGAQIQESLLLHTGLRDEEAKARALSWLARVGLPDPERAHEAYPHQLSGGMYYRCRWWR